jgi:cobalt-zinc-cadmium efflux system protein
MGLHHSHHHTHAHSKGEGLPDHNFDDHNHVDGRSQGRLAIAAILTGLFMIAEVIGGIISGSLALLADAGHMLTDFGALALAWFGFAIARRPATWRHTFGFERFQILSAFVNGLTLIAIAIWIVIEAVQRFRAPNEVLAGTMLYIAIGGLVINLLVFWILMGAERGNLNIRGAVLHVLGDLLGSVAAIAAALIIMKTGWMLIDPLLSVLVALLITVSAWRLVKESGHILLQGAPNGVDRRVIRKDLMENIPELNDVQHFHAWSLSRRASMVTLEAVVSLDTNQEKVRADIKSRLSEQFHLDHATVEVRYDEKSIVPA